MDKVLAQRLKAYMNRLLKQFEESKKMMKMLSGGNKLMRRMPGMRR